jgi:OmpA-OmpF porin, OOP family
MITYRHRQQQKEDFMVRRSLIVLLISLCAISSGFAQGKDIEGSSDHPLFTRMPGFYITQYEVKDFDKYESPYFQGADAVWEGKMTFISYDLKDGAKAPSMVQIPLNFENAVKKIGGKVLVSSAKAGNVMQGKIEKGGAVTYVEAQAFNDGTRYWLIIVEKGAMKQDVVADANALSAALAASGKAVVDGIYFEADKAVLKGESGPAIDQVVKLMSQNPKLKVFVVGHTANAGSVESSVKLSDERAQAIVQMLVSKGVAASRLKAVGVGPYSPAASNRTEEGKALNRRVELVEQ